ncbi:MAG: platelet-activating factor acetylhydrolase IB subunit [Gemmatales bacterium]|nr:platelet-activating factor acetylhydrolase IB subunit [Gemmatales bacterium]MCS7161026.1 platelet-activating factor acetylhydrolase IB subunit [Gemmatales bacterium]MDW8176229.1 platelet-activating factor acetylhydrolase IB subunit [Gemmatales bacterium]MDW8221380.1 platelet-activating factor acetylhydrolase IB subunit [Gemmatales bacterium]
MPTLRSLVCALMAIALPLGTQAQEKLHSAVKPVPRDANWLKRHETFVAIAKRGGIDVLFLGDSITDAWGGEGHNPKAPGASLFEREFVPLKTANFGIGGDRTQHVLWRIQNGELDGIRPKVVMLMIGTNNSNGNDNTAEEIADGITAIVREIHQRSPKTKVLLLGIFPRGKDPSNPAVKAQREKISRVNQIIAKLDDGGKTVKYLDIGHLFIKPDGHIPPEIMPDYLHLSEKGYELWAQAVKPVILELLKQ